MSDRVILISFLAGPILRFKSGVHLAVRLRFKVIKVSWANHFFSKCPIKISNGQSKS